MPGLIFSRTFNPLIPEEIFLASRQHGGNIRQYRKPLNINLGMVIFGAIFLYIIICVVMYLFRDEKVVSYRVQEGVLSEDNVFTGIAMRNETIVTSSSAGYILSLIHI